MTNESENADDPQKELQKALDEIQMLEGELPDLWNLNNSIDELKRTMNAYNRLEPSDG